MNAQQVGRAGEMFVAAEIHRRGGYAVTFAGHMPGIDILASDLTDSRRISIQVKAKRSRTWNARFPRDGAECPEDSGETSYWVFVDLGGEHPEYFIAPAGGSITISGRSPPHTSPRTRRSTGIPGRASSRDPRQPGRAMAGSLGRPWHLLKRTDSITAVVQP